MAAFPHGWFYIPGVQTGERFFKERVSPLAPLLNWSKGARVLDLGCAEGIIGKWLVDAGYAYRVTGIDMHQPWLDTAAKITAGYSCGVFEWIQCDFNEFDVMGSYLDGGYEIVLCLNVAQKLKEPEKFIKHAASLSVDTFVYSGPGRVLKDIRSEHRPVDIEKILSDFTLVSFHPGQFCDEKTSVGGKPKPKGHLGVRMIFRRTKVVRAEEKRRKAAQLAKRKKRRA